MIAVCRRTHILDQSPLGASNNQLSSCADTVKQFAVVVWSYVANVMQRHVCIISTTVITSIIVIVIIIV